MIYFVYAARLDPEQMHRVAPEARFLRIAHLPETRLWFPLDGPGGGLPSIRPDPGHTVWGALFEVPADQAGALDRAEAAEGRLPTDRYRAVDREGNAYEVVTHAGPVEGEESPVSASYLAHMVAGSRHWGLPMGWIAGLEELAEEYTP